MPNFIFKVKSNMFLEFLMPKVRTAPNEINILLRLSRMES